MMKEIRRIDSSKVRGICVEYNFYTCGTIEEYENLLLNLCDRDREIDIDALVEIATDIIEHSSQKSFEPFAGENLTTSIMWYLANECCMYGFIEE